MKKLGFGLMRLPLTDPSDQTAIDLPQVRDMVDLFLAEGFTYFDTAWMYHNHASESILKTALVDRHPRERFTVATKLPMMLLTAREEQERIFAEQLAKCGVAYFDYYMLHSLNADNYAKALDYDSFAFIRQKKAEGLIRRIGFSYHDDANLLDAILTAHHEDVDFVQLQINYLDWDNDGIQSGACHAVARRHNKPVIVMEPVKGGTLAQVPEAVERVFRASRPELSPASWAIRFAAGLDGVLTVLSGMSTLEQLRDNIASMKTFTPLSAAEQETLATARAIMDGAVAIPCTACRYCVEDCPQNIPIPTYLQLYNAHVLDANTLWSPQRAYYENFARKHGKASDCLACRACEGHCPQHLDIVDALREVAATFEATT